MEKSLKKNDWFTWKQINWTYQFFVGLPSKLRKKNENAKSRLCVDFKELNKIVILLVQPFPLIQEINIKNQKLQLVYFINQTFWSIPIRPKDRYKIAFVTQQDHWQWKHMPFGLKTASVIFQRAITSVIWKYNLSEFCVAYIDDILIFSKDCDSHIEIINRVMEAIYREGWKLKFEKCTFAANEMKLLSFQNK